MSRKTLKPLIIGGVVLAILLAAALLVAFWPEAEPSPAESSAPPVVSATQYFINEDFSAFQRVDIMPRGVDRYAIVAVGEGNARSFSVEPAAEGWTYKQDALRSGVFNASSLTALSKITSEVSDDELETYGLNNPVCTIRVEFNDTEKGRRSYTFDIGEKLTLGDSFYARMKDSKEVYAVSAYGIGTFTAPESSYREFNFFTKFSPGDDGQINTDGAISYIRVVEQSLDVDIEIKLDMDATAENSPSAYKMLRPVEANCVDENVIKYLHNLAVQLSPEAIVTDDPTPAQLSEYGFDNARELWLEDRDGNSVHYTLGYFNDSGNGYVMVEGCPSLMLASGLDVSIFLRPYLDYMFKMLVTVDIADVSSVAYTLPDGSRHLLSITEYSKGESGGTTITGLFDGQSISQTNVSRLYSRTLSLTVDGELSDPSDISGSPNLAVSIRLRDGGEKTIDLYALNERHYAASIDGDEAIYFVNAASVKLLIAGFDYLARGEDIPRT